MNNKSTNNILSATAKKVLYLFRKRHIASTMNDFRDEQGNIYIIYTRNELMDKLKLSKPTVIKYVKELSNTGYISEKRNGYSLPNYIYLTDKALANNSKIDKVKNESLTEKLKNRAEESYNEVVEAEEKNCKQKSETAHSRFLNDFSALIADIKSTTYKKAFNQAKRFILDKKDTIAYEKSQELFDNLSKNLQEKSENNETLTKKDRQTINDYLELLSMSIYKKTIRVSGKILRVEEFLKDMQRLTINHILIIDQRIRNVKYNITNYISYSLACLYNSVVDKKQKGRFA